MLINIVCFLAGLAIVRIVIELFAPSLKLRRKDKLSSHKD